MFNHVKPMPADPILNLLVTYAQDQNPDKIDLGVGVYKNELGHTDILDCVKAAEQHRINTEDSKVYIAPTGSPLFNEKMNQLIFGSHQVLKDKRVRTVSTPGGTGALRAAAEFIKSCSTKATPTIWVSDPTWANHHALFTAAGLNIKTYPYYDHDNKCLNFEGMLATLEQVSQDDVVLFHACCHNPSGMDLSRQQWQQIVEVTTNRGFMPLVDMAYQGFGESLDDDAYGVRLLADHVENMIVCSSCSKNFGLYRERIGACSLLAKSALVADNVLSVLLSVIRGIYSMPPAHGAAIVEIILASETLTQQWHQELKVMRDRINNNRRLLSDKLQHYGAQGDFSFITRQAGMFSFLGISPQQVQQLQRQYSIYMVDSSRISIAGISQHNVDYLAKSIASLLS